MGQFPVRTTLVMVLAASLSGCSYLGSTFTNEKIQYETTSTRAPLEVPPDLSQLPSDDRFVVPGKTQVVTATQISEIEEARRASSGAQTEVGVAPVLPSTVVAKSV